MGSSLAASCHSDGEAPADAAVDAAPFSVAAAHVFAAFAASVVDAAVPSAVFVCHQPSAVPPVDVPGLVFVAASAAPVLASGTPFLVPFGISDRSLDFPCSAVCPAGSPLANRWDERSWAGWHCSPPGSCYFPTGWRLVACLDCSQHGCSRHDLGADCNGLLLSPALHRRRETLPAFVSQQSGASHDFPRLAIRDWNAPPVYAGPAPVPG